MTVGPEFEVQHRNSDSGGDRAEFRFSVSPTAEILFTLGNNHADIKNKQKSTSKCILLHLNPLSLSPSF